MARLGWRAVAFWIAALAAAGGFYCFRARPVLVRDARQVLGAIARVEAMASDATRAEQAVDQAFTVLLQVEQDTSLLAAASSLFTVNREADVRAVRVSPSTFRMISASLALSEKTFGAFDITILPLMKLWGFYGKGQAGFRPPEAAQVSEAMKLVGWQLVETHPRDLTVTYKQAGVGIDLTPIAKGYACDLAIETLRREPAVKGGYVEVGDTLRAFGVGPRPDGWPFEVRHPRDPLRSLYRGVLKDEALSVTSDVHKFFVAEGKRYPHVIDPRTGYPAMQSVVVVVVAPDASLADGLSQAFFVLRRIRSAMVYGRWPGVRFISVEQRGDALDAFVSPGFPEGTQQAIASSLTP